MRNVGKSAGAQDDSLYYMHSSRERCVLETRIPSTENIWIDALALWAQNTKWRLFQIAGSRFEYKITATDYSIFCASSYDSRLICDKNIQLQEIFWHFNYLPHLKFIRSRQSKPLMVSRHVNRQNSCNGVKKKIQNVLTYVLKYARCSVSVQYTLSSIHIRNNAWLLTTKLMGRFTNVNTRAPEETVSWRRTCFCP